MPPDSNWSVLVHGGARTIPASARPACEQGCIEAVSAAAKILSEGGSALDAVEAAVRVLEDLPQFNAGHGSVRNEDGQIEMDAAIMDGATLALGGVGALKNVRHAVSVARVLMDRGPTLLVGNGAARFARHIAAEPALDRPSPEELEGDACDTVGCVARDIRGHVAAAGSTGGIEGKMAGRIGDTPLPGCGLYADDELGAAALSGEGEAIARNMLAARALHALGSAAPQEAAAAAIERLKKTGGEAGIILIDPAGRMGVAHNSDHFSVGLASSRLDRPRAATSAQELSEWLQ